MAKKKPAPEAPLPNDALTIHLGARGWAELERCRRLLWDQAPLRDQPSRGQVIRQALAEMLLRMLLVRADFRNLEAPSTIEYLRTLSGALPDGIGLGLIESDSGNVVHVTPTQTGE